MNDIKQEALEYVKLGFPIIPICSPKHSDMSDWHRRNCKAPGKAPILADWPNHIQTSEEEVREWFKKNPNINVGVPLGKASGMVGIDIDGETGERLLKELSNGELPLTLEFTTGKGRRLLYALPEGIDTKKFKHKEKEKGQELAIICDGQQTILPPSVHASGAVYKWKDGRSPRDATIAPAPQWILDKVTQEETGLWAKDDLSPPVTDKEYKESVTEGSRSDKLTRLAGSMLGRGIPEETVLVCLKEWNKDHCIPPIEEEAIEKMVNHLAIVEQAKKARKGRHKAILEPTPFVERFIRMQKDLGFMWKYSTAMGTFFRCVITEGPWEMLDIEAVESIVRKALVEEHREWDSIHHTNEGIKALKALLYTDKERSFDLGISVKANYPDYKPRDIICVRNGVLHWRTLELKPWTPDVHSTIQLPIDWDERADCPVWKRLLSEWLPNDEDTIRCLQEYVGYCLIPDASFRTALFLCGSGRNGKSMFIETVEMLFGDALVGVSLDRISWRFETANLQNKLVNLCTDIDPKYLRETAIIKKIICGEKLEGEFKGLKSFDFWPVCRFIFSSYEIPKAKDKSEGWLGRWLYVRFNEKFKVSSQFKIRTMEVLEGELPGILCWGVQGLKRLKENDEFTVSEAMKRAKEEYQLESDNVADFKYNKIVEDSEANLSTQALYDNYMDFITKDREGSRTVGQIEFTKRMLNSGCKKSNRKINGRSCSCFIGVKLKEREDQLAYESYLKARRSKIKY